jgi:hypothetical protein
VSGPLDSLAGVTPSPQPWTDDKGLAYDWSFTCGHCPGDGMVYVRDGVGHHPSDVYVRMWMRRHLVTSHGIEAD